jgi:hypothetical protein
VSENLVALETTSTPVVRGPKMRGVDPETMSTS